MDIKTAYLNAPIEDNLHMPQTEGFEKFDTKGNPLICKLNKSTYGLKQSGRNWLPTHKEHLENIGFEACIHDPCFFIKNVITWNLAMIWVWLDHIIFYCPENDFRQWFKEKMSSKYIFGESSVFKRFWEKNLSFPMG